MVYCGGITLCPGLLSLVLTLVSSIKFLKVVIMKKIFSVIVFSLLVLTFSCKESFLEFDPQQSVDENVAIQTAEDVTIALNGAYYYLGDNYFLGRNVIALGDIASDNAYMTGSSGHYDAIYLYNIIEQLADLENIWDGGYKVINSTTRIIKAGNTILAAGNLSPEKIASVKGCLAQAHALKALSYFYLVNIFGLPYNSANAATPGIVVFDEPVVAFQTIARAPVGQVYEKILSHISLAKQLFQDSKVSLGKFYFNATALSAFEARVYLYMGDYTKTISAGQTALGLVENALVASSTAYDAMWASIVPSPEDIFTISKTEDDNLSANSLNTLYGSYNGKLTPSLKGLFATTDIRKTTAMTDGSKYQGLASSAATSNIPVIRLPELYLILAEAYAQKGDLDNAKTYLLEIASRDAAISNVSQLPNDKSGILDRISEERRRELYLEGHRWFDLRRNKENLNRATGERASYKNFEVWRYAYPVPRAEINASGIAQNPDAVWKYLPL
jgi:starch-binding outer membrane protein, SusD/RagB family